MERASLDMLFGKYQFAVPYRLKGGCASSVIDDAKDGSHVYLGADVMQLVVLKFIRDCAIRG